MIRVLIQKGKICSVFQCDVCKQPIKRVEDGAVAMPKLFGRDLNADNIEFLYVHKGECLIACEHSPESVGFGDLDLREHIFHLLGNVGWRPKHMAMARQLNEIELF